MIELQEIADKIKKDGKYWIVFVGDSLVSCEWVHPNWREIVEYVLKEEVTKKLHDWKPAAWELRCFNFGYDGSITKDILDRVKDINLVNPDLAISIMGGNDASDKVPVEVHINNIKNIIKKLNTKVVWCTSTPAAKGSAKNNNYYIPYGKACMQIPLNNNLKLIDLFNIYQKFPIEKFFTFKQEGDQDTEHPNQLGNAYIAKVILKEVFEIEFDPEKYTEDALNGDVKYPEY